MSLENALLGYIASKVFSFRWAHKSFFGGNFIISLRLCNFHLLWTFELVDKQLQDINALFKRQILTYTFTTNEYF